MPAALAACSWHARVCGVAYFERGHSGLRTCFWGCCAKQWVLRLTRLLAKPSHDRLTEIVITAFRASMEFQNAVPHSARLVISLTNSTSLDEMCSA